MLTRQPLTLGLQPGKITDEAVKLDGARILGQMTPVAYVLLAILFVMLTLALFVGVLKVLQLTRLVREQRQFRRRADEAASSDTLQTIAKGRNEPGARVLQSLIQRIERGPVGTEELRGVAQQAIVDEERRANFLVSILTAVAATGPLLGLLGTVWGIIESFMAIDQVKSSAIGVIAPSMAGALLTTALGLTAAIPALIAVQYADRRINELTSELDAAAQTWIGALLKT